MKSRDVLALFNRGIVSKLGLARIDVARVSLSAQTQSNWMTRVLGSMTLRPGLEYIGTALSGSVTIPFTYDRNDKAGLELAPGVMRVWLDGDALLTREAVSTEVSNGTFDGNLNDWTDADEGVAVSSYDATSGAMQLLGTGAEAAIRRQAVTVDPADEDTEHALRIIVSQGSALLRVGTSAGSDDLVQQAALRTGTHSIGFTPGTGTIHIQLSTTLSYPVLIASCEVEDVGVLEVPTPWADADACANVRWQRSEDVVFCACTGLKQQRIERRPNNSWSVVDYNTSDGPYVTENVSRTTLTGSAVSGAITLTASQSTFTAGHVGALFKLSSQGQLVQRDISAENTFTDPIRVTGVEATRRFARVAAGTWVGTLSLQRSLDDGGAWVTVLTVTSNFSATYNDALDNSIALYRIGFETGNYTSGTAEVQLEYNNGSITGVVRVVGYISDTEVDAVVLQDLGGTDPTEIWAEGAWSDTLGWPDAVAIVEGRLGWSGQGRNWMSVSDAFTNFDPTYEGDAGPINRAVGADAMQRSNWMLALQRLIVGTADGEHSIRSSSFDEPLTPSNYNSKRAGSKGSYTAPAVIVDSRAYFIGRNGGVIYEMVWDAQRQDYAPRRTTVLTPELFEIGVRRLAVQTEPDERLHCVMNDGTACVLIRDEAEDVEAWITVTTDGLFEDVMVLPGEYDDEVYYTVTRTIEGTPVRYRERLANERDCRGGSLNLQADSFVQGLNDPASAALSGLDHLEGEEVVIYADGEDRGVATVSGGSVTLDTTVTSWVVGLYYEARFRSAKLAASLPDGPTLGRKSRINKLGLILADTHPQGLRFGPDFDTLDDLPDFEDGVAVGTDTWGEYDKAPVEFPGDWDTDNRICLVATAPRSATVLAAVMEIDRNT